MTKLLVTTALVLISNAATCRADTDFIVPEQCADGATGAASNELATDGDPPIVEVYRNSGLTNDRYATINKITKDGDKKWYVSFSAPQWDTYTIKTVYTPFLTAWQSGTYYKGPTEDVPLSLPGGRTTLRSFTVKLGNMLGNAFIEFAPDIVADEPFTMQVDASGNITVYCYTKVFGGQSITVYNEENEFVNTGRINDDGTISWTANSGN
jgi:hypothetical protein